ncbi:MAG: HDOD domain-containing protein [Oceanospirillaceae bacterium]|nr:HDOD domain-containing protein [Oceanospirillaceae bacterium]
MALAMAVMKDPGLSAKRLRVAKSPGYNRGQGRIEVVSRAVILLGFERIKSLSMTLKPIESFDQRCRPRRHFR